MEADLFQLESEEEVWLMLVFGFRFLVMQVVVFFSPLGGGSRVGCLIFHTSLYHSLSHNTE